MNTMMKRTLPILAVILLVGVPAVPAKADLDDFLNMTLDRQYQFLEEFYSLYARGLTDNQITFSERVRMLHLAAEAPFDFPQRALAPCRTEVEYEKYQYLMYFRIAFLLSKSYKDWAMQFDKEDVYWMDLRYADVLLKGFLEARRLYEVSLYYWYKTLQFAQLSYARRNIMLDGEEMTAIQEDVYRVMMADELTRIETNGDLFHLSEQSPLYRVYRNRQAFLDYRFGSIITHRMQRIDEKVDEICASNMISRIPQAVAICENLEAFRTSR